MTPNRKLIELLDELQAMVADTREANEGGFLGSINHNACRIAEIAEEIKQIDFYEEAA